MPDPAQTSVTRQAGGAAPSEAPPAGAGDSLGTLNLRGAHSSGAAPEPVPELAQAAAEATAGTGQALVGDYELLSEVGRGGMGVVYKARHRGLNRIVALKVARPGHLLSDEMARRFQVEAAAIAKLDHPNIVPVYEIGEAYGQPFFSMAFVEGESLADAVTRSPLPPRRAAELAHLVAAAIAYAHGQGVIHRDLKPDNILLDASGRPRITDFGIAKFLDADNQLTRAGEIMGTPSYMPPEQAQGKMDQVGPAADVYSLGATLYCLMTGRPPFQAATALETFQQVVEQDPVPPRRLNPAVDRDLETICLKCLEKRPERRYASVAALADDLQRFLDRQPIQAQPIRLASKAVRWGRRNPLSASLSAGALVVFLSSFAVVSWSYWRAEEAFRAESALRETANLARDAAIRHEKAERWERYRATMATVASAFQSQNVAAARRAIEAAPTEHRNWEWRHFQQQLDRSQRVFVRPPRAVERVRFLGKGKLAIAGREIHVWDLSTDQSIPLPDYAWTEGNTLMLSPDGQTLAYTSRDHSMTLWDLAAGQPKAVLRGPKKEIATARFSANGEHVVVYSHDNQARVWDITGKLLHAWTISNERSETLGYSASSRYLVLSREMQSESRLLESESGRLLHLLPGHEARVYTVAFSPEEDRVVTAECYPSNVMRLWDTRSGKQIAILRGHSNEAHSIRFSPDGSRIASCSFDQTVRLWDGKTGAAIATMRGHTGRVITASFSPDSKRLVSASQDHTLRLWDARTGEPISVLYGHAGDVQDVAYESDGRRIASASDDGTARIWDAQLAERNGILRGHSGFVYGVAFHPDGRHVASASWDGTVRLWDATAGQEAKVLRYPAKTFLSSLTFHPSGRLLATYGRDNTVRLWDWQAGESIHAWNVPTDTWQDGRLGFNSSGNLLAAAGKDGAVHLLDVDSRTTLAVLQGHRDAVHSVVFGPNDRWLASGGAVGDKTICIWDLTTKKPSSVLAQHTGAVFSLTVSPDGRLLASGSGDGTVRLWDTTAWEEVGILKHGTNVYDLAFTPDGSRLATACADNSIRFWDVASRQEVAELRGHDAYVHGLAFSPDGTRLVSGSGDFTVRVWDTLSARKRAEDEEKSR